MSHKCGPGCRRKQTPSTRKDCPSCGSRPANKLPVNLAMTAGGRTRALTQHVLDGTHPGVTLDMVAQALDGWLVRGINTDREGGKSRVYFGFPHRSPFLLRVVVSMDDQRIVAAFRDRNATKRWAVGDLAYFDKYVDVEERGDRQ